MCLGAVQVTVTRQHKLPQTHKKCSEKYTGSISLFQVISISNVIFTQSKSQYSLI